jgi:hypothetical protein
VIEEGLATYHSAVSSQSCKFFLDQPYATTPKKIKSFALVFRQLIFGHTWGTVAGHDFGQMGQVDRFGHVVVYPGFKADFFIPGHGHGRLGNDGNMTVAFLFSQLAGEGQTTRTGRFTSMRITAGRDWVSDRHMVSLSLAQVTS